MNKIEALKEMRRLKDTRIFILKENIRMAKDPEVLKKRKSELKYEEMVLRRIDKYIENGLPDDFTSPWDYICDEIDREYKIREAYLDAAVGAGTHNWGYAVVYDDGELYAEAMPDVWPRDEVVYEIDPYDYCVLIGESYEEADAECKERGIDLEDLIREVIEMNSDDDLQSVIDLIEERVNESERWEDTIC